MIRAALLIAIALATVARAEPVTEVHYVMGTYYRITAEGDDVVPVLRGCFQDARRLEQVYSRFDATSELSRVNAAASACAFFTARLAASTESVAPATFRMSR